MPFLWSNCAGSYLSRLDSWVRISPVKSASVHECLRSTDLRSALQLGTSVSFAWYSGSLRQHGEHTRLTECSISAVECRIRFSADPRTSELSGEAPNRANYVGRWLEILKEERVIFRDLGRLRRHRGVRIGCSTFISTMPPDQIPRRELCLLRTLTTSELSPAEGASIRQFRLSRLSTSISNMYFFSKKVISGRYLSEYLATNSRPQIISEPHVTRST
jgi:hypothetical protein